MATLAIQPPEFLNTGANKEPIRGSLPVGPNAAFFEHDFLILGPNLGSPQVNGSQLNPPSAVDATAITTGGSLAAGTYLVTTTYTNAAGETTIGPVTSVTTTGSTSTMTVQSPPISGDATGYNVYVGTALGTYHKQTGSPTAIGTNTAMTSYSAGGAAPPTTNGTGLAAPTIPTVAAGGTTGPALARTEYVTVTYVDENGETLASPEASQALTSGQLLTVTSPGASGDATGYNVYASTTSGQEVKQNATPIAIGTNWTEPTTGLVPQGVQRAVANQPGLVNNIPVFLGLADHDYNAVYGGPVGGVQPGALSDPFGRPNFNQSGFGITEGYVPISTEPRNAHFISGAACRFAVCLKQAWDPGFLGQNAGLNIDSQSNFFIADMSQTNGVLQIVGTVDGPGWGGPGDVNKRVIVKVNGAYLADVY